MIGVAAVETGVVAVRDGAVGLLGLAVSVITADTRWSMGGLIFTVYTKWAQCRASMVKV